MIFSNILVYIARNSNCLHSQNHAFGNNWDLLIILSSFFNFFILIVTQTVLVNWQDPKELSLGSYCQALGKGKREDIVMKITTLFEEPPCFNLIPKVSYCLMQAKFIWILESIWDLQYLWSMSNAVPWSRCISDLPCLWPCKMSIVTRFSCIS